MPDYRLEGFRVGSDVCRIDNRNNDTGVRRLRGIASIAPYHSENGRANLFGILESRNQVRADVLLYAATAYREDQNEVFSLQSANAQPFREYARPALIVRPRG